MLQLFKNDNGYEFGYGDRAVLLTQGTIFVDGVDILTSLRKLEGERAVEKNNSVILGLTYQGDKYHIHSMKTQFIALSSFKYLTFSGNGLRNMYVFENNGNYFTILWVSPLEPISVNFGFFTSTISTPQWAILDFGTNDPRTITENFNISDMFTFVGFFGESSKQWDSFSYLDSPLVEFKVLD